MRFMLRVKRLEPLVISRIVVLVLVVIALIAELLPEMEAKLIVMPTLILVLVVGLLELKNKK
jgi:hypothetical protein